MLRIKPKSFIMLKKMSFWNTVSRILFLLLTPVFFRWFNFGFIWHSIYWGVVSIVVLIWSGFMMQIIKIVLKFQKLKIKFLGT